MIPPRHIVLSGGGVKVISLVGALQHLEEKGHLRSVKEYCGVSAGAFLAFMMSLQIHQSPSLIYRLGQPFAFAVGLVI